jgi:CSLREA domain-containing protein
MNHFLKLLVSFCIFFCLSQTTLSATYTVTKIADTNDGRCEEDCSLREAIVAANATADNDTIEFSPAVFNSQRLITLSGTDLIITSNGTLTINGTGTALLTVSGGNASRVFTNRASAITEIRNLRVIQGNGVSSIDTGRGGGVYNDGGVLTLNNVIVTGNTATNGGGLSNASGLSSGATSVLSLINCTVEGNTTGGSGGGIQNFSGNNRLNLLNSTISGNSAGSTNVGGGGIQANGMIVISNTTISGNTTSGDGGGIYYNGQLSTLNNVTIVNNAASDQTGGFHKAVATSVANFRNTLVAGNTGGGSPEVSGVINSLGNNLIQTVGTSSGWVATDILGQSAQIAPLNNNGGLTRTHALLFDSPALNAGNNCVVNQSCPSNNPPIALTTDQRGPGFPRRGGSAVDIGAFEFAAPCNCAPPTFDFDGDRRTDYATFSPRDAIWALIRSSAGDSLRVQFGAQNDRLAPADYDGDGKTDIAVWREGALAYFYILNSSNNTFRTDQLGQTGDSPIVVGDWDGDGRADPAVYRGATTPGGQSVFLFRPSARRTASFATINWGTFGDEPVRGDFDGDGKMDPAVYRASSNQWLIRQSSDNQSRFERWGLPEDRRVPNDYDGDGRTDLATFNDGLWSILESSGRERYERFGEASDFLVPGDYDGDGKVDLAVWRNGIFFVLSSNTNLTETTQLGDGSDIPVASAFNR